MSAFSFSSDFHRMTADLGKIAKNVQKKERAAVKLAANEYKTDVQRDIQYKSGTLRRSVHVEMTREGNAHVAMIGTDVVYAKQREYGGFIKAKNAPYLVFKTYDGQWVKTKLVYQPPHPVWRPVWDRNLPKYRRMLLTFMTGEKFDVGAYQEEWDASAAITATLRPDLTRGLL